MKFVLVALFSYLIGSIPFSYIIARVFFKKDIRSMGSGNPGTTNVFRNFGVSLNRSSKDQIKNGTAVSKSNLQPGDIVIFKNQGKTVIGHVGI